LLSVAAVQLIFSYFYVYKYLPCKNVKDRKNLLRLTLETRRRLEIERTYSQMAARETVVLLDTDHFFSISEPFFGHLA
jgi:hypothetical protein